MTEERNYGFKGTGLQMFSFSSCKTTVVLRVFYYLFINTCYNHPVVMSLQLMTE